jgi:hypothetical protein
VNVESEDEEELEATTKEIEEECTQKERMIRAIKKI